MRRIQGRFYLTLTVNGNLLGEFSNNGTAYSQPECAERINRDNQLPTQPFTFVGDYRSSWFEENNTPPQNAQLVIRPRDHSFQIFTLLWFVDNATLPRFTGEAMLAENLLIGNYWMEE